MAISSVLNGSGLGENFLHNAASTSFAQALAAGAPASGDTLFLLASAGQNNQDVSAVAQSSGTVTWSKPIRSNTLLDAVIWKGLVGAGASATVNGTSLLAGNTSNIRGTVLRFTGNPDTDGPSSGSSGSGTSVATASVTPTAGRECLILYAVRAQNGGISAPSAGWTALTSGSTGYAFGYRVVPSASGSYQATFTQTSGNYETAIAVFYPPGAGNAPTATITSQSGYTSYEVGSGRPITFTGTGSDTEDGTLTGASLAWSSSLDGALGTGTSITTSALSVGTHTITLTATDSNSNTGTATKTVVVKDSTSAQFYKRNVAATALAGNGAFTFGMQVYVPANYDNAVQHPTITELGGSGQRGTDNTTQMGDGFAAKLVASPSSYNTYGALWIFPQYPALGTYGGREWAYPMIAAALAATEAEWTCDVNRRNLTGYSLGGFIALEDLYESSSTWASVLTAECAISNREGLLSGNDPAGTWTDAQAAAEVAPIAVAALLQVRQYQDSADTNVPPATAQVTRDAFWAVDAAHTYYHYLTTTGLGHVAAYQAMQADTSNITWMLAQARANPSDPNPTPPSSSNRRTRLRRTAGVLL